jgi:KUP system potassium uptake protein
VRQSLVDFGNLSEPAILGALSLIVWALVLVVTVKYVFVIMHADNRGEGGLLALTALVLRTARRTQKRYIWIMAAGLVGAALFYGDGVITPAISVLSAVEGLRAEPGRRRPCWHCETGCTPATSGSRAAVNGAPSKTS